MTAGSIGVVHVHSAYSHDGRDTLPEIHAWAAERGIAFVGLTDHAEDFTADVFARFTAECEQLSDARVRLIPGLEFRFAGYRGMHLLALGLRRWIEPVVPEDFPRLTRGAAELTIVAHPVLPRYRVPQAVLDAIDAIEVWNAGYNTRYLPDPRAIRMLRRLQRARPEVVGTAGLDQHDRRNDRQIRVRLERDAASPLGELRAGRFTNMGLTMHFDGRRGPGAVALAGLTAARLLFDGVERTQEHVLRSVRSWRSA